jgi:hypothetical protein
MEYAKYEKILKKGEKVDWYGVEVPEELLTSSVRFASENLSHELDKLESSLDELKGSDLEKRKSYIKVLLRNLQNLPYVLNGDFYLKKKKSIESEIEDTDKKIVKEKKKISKSSDKKVVRTKNNDLIFGKK